MSNFGNTSPTSRQTDSFNLFKYASPQAFFPIAGKLIPFCAVLALILCVAGFYVGFLVAPTDAQQHDAYRIIYLHVGAAWMSMFIYMVMAFWAGLGLILNTRLSSMMASALAPTGAMFTFLALWTGAFWGRPTWGAWWVWDARLTSELILLFLYIGFIALQASIDEPRRADKAGAVLAYGNFLTISLNFLILAFIIFQMVRLFNKMKREEPAAPAPVAVTPEDIVLLREIRDALKTKG